MSEHKLDSTVIHAVIDGELPASEHAAALESINNDATSSLLHAQYRRLKLAVSSLPTVEIPSGAWKSCTKRLDELDRNRRAERFVTRYAWGLCASIFLLIVGASSWNRFTGQHMGAGDLSHMASILSPFDRTGVTDTANVGKWLQDRVGPVSINRIPNGSPLSAEYGHAGDTPMARVILADPSGTMVLYVWRGSDQVDGFVPIAGGPLSAGRVLDQNCVGWIQNDCHFVLAGPREVQDLARVAGAIEHGAISISSQ